MEQQAVWCLYLKWTYKAVDISCGLIALYLMHAICIARYNQLWGLVGSVHFHNLRNAGSCGPGFCCSCFKLILSLSNITLPTLLQGKPLTICGWGWSQWLFLLPQIQLKLLVWNHNVAKVSLPLEQQKKKKKAYFISMDYLQTQVADLLQVSVRWLAAEACFLRLPSSLG